MHGSRIPGVGITVAISEVHHIRSLDIDTYCVTPLLELRIFFLTNDIGGNPIRAHTETRHRTLPGYLVAFGRAAIRAIPEH